MLYVTACNNPVLSCQPFAEYNVMWLSDGENFQDACISEFYGPVS